ncbi:WD40-repeat-containing domain protein [Mortierella sp. GBAus27b]|nr:WD40-repeat-containing domain protein [Mortierella sp. GBAus27b]
MKDASEVKRSPKDDQVATCSYDKTARVWDLATGECRHVLQGHSSLVMCLDYSIQGDQIATGSSDTTIRIWDVKIGACIRTLTGHKGWVKSVIYSPCGDGVHNILYSPNGRQIAPKSADKTIRLWDGETKECAHIMQGYSGILWRRLHGSIVECRDWTVQAGHIRSQPKDFIYGEVFEAVYSPRGDLLISGSMDKTLRLWDVESGQCLATNFVLDSVISRLRWIEWSGGQYVAAASVNGPMGVWKVEHGHNHGQLKAVWMTTKGRLTVMGANIQDAQGLDMQNASLLRQIGASGEPVDMSREARMGSDADASIAVTSRHSRPSWPFSPWPPFTLLMLVSLHQGTSLYRRGILAIPKTRICSPQQVIGPSCASPTAVVSSAQSMEMRIKVTDFCRKNGWLKLMNNIMAHSRLQTRTMDLKVMAQETLPRIVCTKHKFIWKTGGWKQQD